MNPTLYFSSSTINTGTDPNGATWSGTVWNSTGTGSAPTQGWVDGNEAVIPDSPNSKATGILLGGNRSVSAITFGSSPGTGIVYLDGLGSHGLTLANGSNPVDVTVNDGQAALVFASVSGSNGLKKLGAGSFEIRGSATGMSGTLEIAEGTLFGGSTQDAFNLSSGLFHINGGLMGSGNEVVSMNVGASIVMTTGALSVSLDGDTGIWAMKADADLLLSGGEYKLTILGLDNYDQITGSGSGSAFTLTGTTVALQSGSSVNYTATYQIFSGFASGDSSGVSFSGFDSGYTPQISSSGELSFVAIPEPATAVLVAFALVGGLFVRNRRGA